MLRLFAGVYPDAPWAGEALRLLELVRLPPRARPTPAQTLHLTLQFIGDTADKDLPSVIESVERCAAGIGAFELTPSRLIALPARGDARLIALELDAPPNLTEIHRRLVSRLARRPRADHGERFLPHMTLCRFEPTGPPEGLPRAVDMAGFRVAELVVMRSILHPSGASHSPLRRVPLADPPRRSSPEHPDR